MFFIEETFVQLTLRGGVKTRAIGRDRLACGVREVICESFFACDAVSNGVKPTPRQFLKV
jgi:hypothetical protein